MRTLEDIPLGQDGLDYLRDSLKRETGMASRLFDLPLSDGLTFAPLPKGTATSRAKKFHAGGIMKMREAEHWLGSHLEMLSAKFPLGTVVIQDIWAKPSDPIIAASTKSCFVRTDDQIYYCVPANMCDELLVIKAMRDVTSFLLVGVFTRFAAFSAVRPSDGKVDDLWVENVVRDTEELFVGAYDQESFVMWQRQADIGP
jgi:hypothetical protein